LKEDWGLNSSLHCW